jgi:hypothetical protein
MIKRPAVRPAHNTFILAQYSVLAHDKYYMGRLIISKLTSFSPLVFKFQRLLLDCLVKGSGCKNPCTDVFH